MEESSEDMMLLGWPSEDTLRSSTGLASLLLAISVAGGTAPAPPASCSSSACSSRLGERLSRFQNDREAREGDLSEPGAATLSPPASSARYSEPVSSQLRLGLVFGKLSKGIWSDRSDPGEARATVGSFERLLLRFGVGSELAVRVGSIGGAAEFCLLLNRVESRLKNLSLFFLSSFFAWELSVKAMMLSVSLSRSAWVVGGAVWAGPPAWFWIVDEAAGRFVERRDEKVLEIAMGTGDTAGRIGKL